MNKTDLELLYAATVRCSCGAGLAYALNEDHFGAVNFVGKGAWTCSAVLKGEASPDGNHLVLPWAFYKVREETSINNRGGETTRPAGSMARTVGKAVCPKCGAAWESDPYNACGLSHHWFPGPCPGCGYAVGTAGVHKSSDGEPVETRYRDVVLSI